MKRQTFKMQTNEQDSVIDLLTQTFYISGHKIDWVLIKDEILKNENDTNVLFDKK